MWISFEVTKGYTKSIFRTSTKHQPTKKIAASNTHINAFGLITSFLVPVEVNVLPFFWQTPTPTSLI